MSAQSRLEPASRGQRGWSLCVLWALASAVGWASLALSAIPLWGAIQALRGNASLALQFVVGGLVLSALQAWVLRRSLPASVWWGLATALGLLLYGLVFALATLLLSMLPDVPPGLVWLQLVVGGSLLGVPQWLVLRRFVAHASWWVGASTAGWGLGVVVVLVSIFLTAALPTIGLGLPAPLAPAVRWSGLLAVGGAVYGTVLGLALLGLTRTR